MPTRIESILKNARYSLADPAKDRYSDERLLALLDEANKDFVRETKLLKAEIFIPVSAGQTLYDLPEDVYQILRCTCNGVVLPLLSFDEMDDLVRRELVLQSRPGTWLAPHADQLLPPTNLAWEEIEGLKVEAVLLDKRRTNQIRIWPIPVPAVLPYSFADQAVFGVVTSIDDYALFPLSGEVASFAAVGPTPDTIEQFGVVSDVLETNQTLRIQYIQVPESITSVNDQLLIAPQWDVALKHYIVGHAFRDDLDTQYRARGAEELTLYERLVTSAKLLEQANAARSPKLYTVHYRTPFT